MVIIRQKLEGAIFTSTGRVTLHTHTHTHSLLLLAVTSLLQETEELSYCSIYYCMLNTHLLCGSSDRHIHNLLVQLWVDIIWRSCWTLFWERPFKWFIFFSSFEVGAGFAGVTFPEGKYNILISEVVNIYKVYMYYVSERNNLIGQFGAWCRWQLKATKWPVDWQQQLCVEVISSCLSTRVLISVWCFSLSKHTLNSSLLQTRCRSVSRSHSGFINELINN